MKKFVIVSMLFLSLLSQPAMAKSYEWNDVTNTFKTVGAFAVKITGKAFKKAIAPGKVLIYTGAGAVECYVNDKPVKEVAMCGLEAGKEEAYKNIIESIEDAKKVIAAAKQAYDKCKSDCGEVVDYVKDKSIEFGAIVLEKGQVLGKKAFDTGKELGGVALDKGKDLGGVALDKGKELGGVAFDKGKELGGATLDKAKEKWNNLPRPWGKKKESN
ncbi:MAG: hypothetical protein CR974_00370 [Gammaproteobacteria bacterium]|nr:MAG: hypothetical protein CR974_00370 [Gammaproteobacteria bacterium]